MDVTQNENTEPESQQEQFERKAKELAGQAALGGQKAKTAALATWRGANTVAEKMLIVGGAVGLVSFFLPWVSAAFLGMSINMSGLEMARRGQTSYWLFPVMMAGALLFAWLNLQGDARKRILNARWLILIGAAWSWVWVNTFLAANASSAGVGFGGFLAFLSSLLVLVSGIMQVQDSLRLLSGPPLRETVAEVV